MSICPRLNEGRCFDYRTNVGCRPESWGFPSRLFSQYSTPHLCWAVLGILIAMGVAQGYFYNHGHGFSVTAEGEKF